LLHGRIPVVLTAFLSALAIIDDLGLLGGMGFTMSIFIASLGFTTQPETLVAAKTAILLASLLAGISGFLWLRFQGRAAYRGNAAGGEEK
jgi:Na+/H+ antiporter NhaA